MFTAIYTHAPTLPARVIRAIDGGEASHVGIGLPGRVVWDVTLRHGVRCWASESAWLREHDRRVVVRVPFTVADPVAASGWLHAREGDGYDVWGALGIGLFTNMDDPGRHFCSELLVNFCIAGGMVMPDQRKRVGPRLSLAWIGAMRPA
jgi:hypothetical protein